MNPARLHILPHHVVFWLRKVKQTMFCSFILVKAVLRTGDMGGSCSASLGAPSGDTAWV